MDNFDLKKYINEGRIHSPINLNENLESQAISILKKYKNEIGEVGKYIEYLNNIPSNDDVHSAIQAIADDLDRDNYIEDDLRVELEKLSLAEGKLNENQGDMYGRGPAYQALDSGIQYYIDQFIRDIEEEKEEDGTEYLNDLIKAIAALRDSVTFSPDLAEGRLLKEEMSLDAFLKNQLTGIEGKTEGIETIEKEEWLDMFSGTKNESGFDDIYNLIKKGKDSHSIDFGDFKANYDLKIGDDKIIIKYKING